jgi:hypothetical protein
MLDHCESKIKQKNKTRTLRIWHKKRLLFNCPFFPVILKWSVKSSIFQETNNNNNYETETETDFTRMELNKQDTSMMMERKQAPPPIQIITYQ